MKIHVYEKAFLSVGLVVLVACAAALVYATLAHGLHLPGASGRVDPATVSTTPPFDRPGVYQRGPDEFEVVVIGRAWSFQPLEVRVPADVEVTFTATAVDVLHGFNIEGTRLNMMLIPGQISRNTYRFEEPGEYLVICHEYCGLGHHMMAGRIIVEPAGTQVPLVGDAPVAAGGAALQPMLGPTSSSSPTAGPAGAATSHISAH